MATTQYGQVVDPEKLMQVRGLFDSEPSSTDVAPPRPQLDANQKATNSQVEGVGLASGLVTDNKLLEELKTAFATEVKGGRQQVLKRVDKPETDKPSWADWVAPSLSISSSLAAGIPAARYGAMAGAAFPPYGPAVGATVAGLAATIPLVFGSEYAGNAVEDLVEGREFNPDRAFQEAMDAAQTDAIIQIALPVIGTSAKTIYTGGKKLLTGKAGLTDDAIEEVADFQARLKDYDPDLTLLPAAATRGKKTYSTQIARVSQLSKKTVERLLTGYDKYMGAQINEVIGKFKGATPSEQGEALQTFIQQSKMAIDDIVDPIYKNIDKLGKGVIVDPAQAGMVLAQQFKKKHRGKSITDPETGRITVRSAYPTSATASAVSRLRNLPSDLNFYEAHKRLSEAKKRLYNANKSTTKDSDLVEVLGAEVDMYAKVMKEAADTLSPALRKEYEDVTNFYSKSRDVVTASFLDKAVKVLDPSQIGAMLTKDGLEVPVSQIKNLKKLAAELKSNLPKGSTVKGLDEDPLSGIRKGYLEQMFKLGGEGGQKSIAKFQKKLQEPKFKATFDALFEGTPVVKNMERVLKDLDILDSINKGGGGLQLSVAGAEYGVAKGSNPNILTSIRDLIPSFLAKRNIKQKNVDKLINMIKAATEAERRGVKLSPAYAMELNNLLGVIKVGQGLGAASGTME
jgi:hypothetical protein